MEMSVCGCRLPRVSRRTSSASRSSSSAAVRSPLAFNSRTEVVDGDERVWVPTAEGLALHLQRLALQRLSGGEVALDLQQHAEVVDGDERVGMPIAEGLALPLQRLAVQRLSGCEVTLAPQQLAEVVGGVKRVRMPIADRSSGGAPRFRSERPSSIARVSPPRCAVAESSRGLRPTRRQPTRLPSTRRAHRARQRYGWRRSRAPGASPDCCGYAAAAVAPRRCARAASAAPTPLHGQSEQQFARASPRRADHQTVVRACSGATASDCCSFDGGQPRVEWRRPLHRQLA